MTVRPHADNWRSWRSDARLRPDRPEAAYARWPSCSRISSSASGRWGATRGESSPRCSRTCRQSRSSARGTGGSRRPASLGSGLTTCAARSCGTSSAPVCQRQSPWRSQGTARGRCSNRYNITATSDLMEGVGRLEAFLAGATATPNATRREAQVGGAPEPVGTVGAGERNRTADPFITSEVLYQLSYTSSGTPGAAADRGRAGTPSPRPLIGH